MLKLQETNLLDIGITKETNLFIILTALLIAIIPAVLAGAAP